MGKKPNHSLSSQHVKENKTLLTIKSRCISRAVKYFQGTQKETDINKVRAHQSHFTLAEPKFFATDEHSMFGHNQDISYKQSKHVNCTKNMTDQTNLSLSNPCLLT